MLKLLKKIPGIYHENNFAYPMMEVQLALYNIPLSIFFIFNSDGSIAGFLNNMEPADLSEDQKNLISMVYDTYVAINTYS